MKQYLTLYGELGLPEFAIALARGEYANDYFEPVRWRRFPPALLPLCEHYKSDFGYWQHWFAEDRPVTIVSHNGLAAVQSHLSVMEMINGWDPIRVQSLIVTEVACTLEQFVRIQILDWLCNGEGEWTEEIRNYAAAAGLSDEEVDFIDQVSEEEFEPIAFIAHPLFKDAPPLSAFPKDAIEDYPGDFPHWRSTLDASNLESICTYEIHSSYMYQPLSSEEPDIREQLAERTDVPPWFTRRPKQEVFDELLSAGDLKGAWMTLNSIGWRTLEAVIALRQLAERSGDPLFGLLVDAYSSMQHEDDDWY